MTWNLQLEKHMPAATSVRHKSKDSRFLPEHWRLDGLKAKSTLE